MLAVTLVVALLAPAGSAGATGVGGSAGFEHDVLVSDRDDRRDIHLEITSLGFIVDTAVIRDRLFNYRLLVGPAAAVARGEKGAIFGLFTRNTFGFGVYRGRAMRCWVGPAARVTLFMLGGGILFSFGGGPELGLNLKLSRAFALSVSIGYQACRSVRSGGWPDGVEHLFGLNVAALFLTPTDRAPTSAASSEPGKRRRSLP